VALLANAALRLRYWCARSGVTRRSRCAILRRSDARVNPLGILLGAVFRAWGLIVSENVFAIGEYCAASPSEGISELIF
jgi:hypothetical protein